MEKKSIIKRFSQRITVIGYWLMIIGFTSCLDTIILPEDKTVDEDFWKTKSDVSSMVNAAYAGMTSEDFIMRLVVWGGFRSDEMVRSTSIIGTTSDALEEIAAVNIQVTNMFASWASVYSVINRCNIVLERAASVMLEDPSYTESDYESDRCQMLALRSLCYFYLVRNFRDVPYITEAYMNSSQNTQVAQSSPEYVIGQIIETLEEVANNPNCLRSNSYTNNEWRRVGWMTLDGVMALLADVYLWRASVMHSSSDYQKCVDYCQKVIESKRTQHVQGRNELELKEYPLADGNQTYKQLFVEQNAEESIFELQSTNNTGLIKYLYKYVNNNSSEGYIKASNIFGTAAGAPNQIGVSTVFAAQDLRFYTATFSAAGGAESFDVYKMIATTNSNTGKTQQSRPSDRNDADQNYIVYRLTDVMLMKAEAIAQLMQDVDIAEGETANEDVAAFNDSLRHEIFNLVEAVNTRSIAESDKASYAMQWNAYKDYTKSQWETYILQERLRELCFEGKRWYDLLRYNYRHIEGVQYDQTLGKMAADAAATNATLSLPPIYDEMLSLATRSRGTDAQAIKAKMQNEAYLYMPIPDSDINVCPLLIQNPAYKSGNTYEKTY
jgi:hypothetical protein